MDEEEFSLEEEKKGIEEASEGGNSRWRKYLALSTALIAVMAAMASYLSADYSNEAVITKNDAIFLIVKANDNWALYQAKGIKRSMAESFYGQTHNAELAAEAERYRHQQDSIRAIALTIEKQTEEKNKESEALLGHHHRLALSVTIFQISIAISAISALLMRKKYWYFSLALAAVATCLMIIGLI